MPGTKTEHSAFWPLKRQLIILALPRLSELPQSGWDEAIERARQVHFDGVERIAMVVSVAFVAFLLSFSSEQMASLAFFTRYLIQFALALPLLFLLLAPFYLRRLRRGLDAVILNRNKKPAKDLHHEA